MQEDVKKSFAPAFTDGFAPEPVRAAYAVRPVFDPARYWSYLDAVEATDDEKQALLQTLWDLMARFVELGFGVDPVQTVIPALIEASMTEDGADDRTAQSDIEYVSAPRFNRAARRKRKENNNDNE